MNSSLEQKKMLSNQKCSKTPKLQVHHSMDVIDIGQVKKKQWYIQEVKIYPA